ncbi:DUF1918 domain-containing protein [Actinomycetospora sp. NBRC 106378]|uniref:DUF1918 domain-containing protein n=1 Tax=Actinomycetospora sp. NBRC 106378 TaxID=3032208 RepID=UPI0024A32889|nr:DUF1918 domain-containing protein [Actinomycetospora sp. NBRC 106378]GLZ54119.1 hypothetical protein Acsp07_37360 [Actinomycetospora sp. NBRC 106378]
MSANVGDRITLHANSVDAPDRTGTIVGVLGTDGPPYRVRYDNGDETILTPGPDATIEPPSVRDRLDQAAEKASEKATELAGEARATAEDVTGRAARTVADTAAKIAERFQR